LIQIHLQLLFKNLHRFAKDYEEKYKEYRLQRDVFAIRFSGIAVILYTLSILYRDYFLVSDYSMVVLIRGLSILTTAGVVWLAYSKQLTTGNINVISLIGLIFYVGCCFVLDYRVDMPDYFLPNILILSTFVSFIGLGVFFAQSFITNLGILATFFVYTLFISDDKEAHLSLSFNVIINYIAAGVIGYLFERESRINFHQHMKLLLTNQKLDKANMAKNKILSLLSHDLNVPLRNLAGILNLKSSSAISEKELDEYLEKVKVNLESSSSLLSNLTRWSKSQTEEFKPNFAEVNISVLIRGVLDDQGSVYQDKGIKMVTTISPDLTWRVDIEMIKSALRNLISNSIKFSAEKSTISIHAEANTEQLTITIKDQGVGIPKENINRLLEGELLSTPGTRNEKGTGIGLQLAYDFIKHNNGSLGIQSELGMGTMFIIQLGKNT
jgi:signal transduction histidine kinase